MSFSNKLAKSFQQFLPSPFTIAVLLTGLTFILAFAFTKPPQSNSAVYFAALLGYWEQGIWESDLLVFAVQMMLMLVLGHVVALTKPIKKAISIATQYCNNTAISAVIVCVLTMMVGLFNWGLGLIFGAVLARSIGQRAKDLNLAINYPIIGACAYVGMMVWHGGLSGSALIKVAEPNHLKQLMNGIFSQAEMNKLPEFIGFDQTVFSSINLFVTAMLFLIIPFGMYRIGKVVREVPIELPVSNFKITENSQKLVGAERLDNSKIVAYVLGGFMLITIFLKAFWFNKSGFLSFFTPNNINFLLFSLGILLHGNFKHFLMAIDEAIGGASAILIQFPLYFGIMGIMKSSGLVVLFSEGIVSFSNAVTFPIFTFLSAALINIFVPSGGGQWAIQGPIILQSSAMLPIDLSKTILAMAYGDQLTNMLQPFWALPLLGITGLKARQILPYTLILFVLGFLIFSTALLIF